MSNQNVETFIADLEKELHEKELTMLENDFESFTIKFRMDEMYIHVVCLGHTHGAAVH